MADPVYYSGAGWQLAKMRAPCVFRPLATARKHSPAIVVLSTFLSSSRLDIAGNPLHLKVIQFQ